MVIRGFQCERLEAPEPFITLEDAKDELSVNHDLFDGKIGAYIAAACAELDGPNTVTRTPFKPQKWRVYFTTKLHEAFLPFPNLSEVIGVSSRDPSGSLIWAPIEESAIHAFNAGPGFVINFDKEVDGLQLFVDVELGSDDVEVPADIQIAAKLRIRQLFTEAPDKATEDAWNRIAFNYGGS